MDKRLQARLKEGAQLTANAAISIASVFSKRIPGAISVNSDKTGAQIISDGTKAPSGRPNEFALRHPVFGDKEHWVTTPHRPYMEVAEARTIDQVTDIVAGWLDDISKDAGFK